MLVSSTELSVDTHMKGLLGTDSLSVGSETTLLVFVPVTLAC